MRENEVFTVADFARLSQTPRDTLIYYDSIGLLSPAVRKKNNYRFYSTDQLAVMELINVCRLLEMPLAKIKKLIRHRTPDVIAELLDKQIKDLGEKTALLRSRRKLLSHMRKIILSTLSADVDNTCIRFIDKEPVMFGDWVTRNEKNSEGVILRGFYQSCGEAYPAMDLSYPVGGFFLEQRIKSGSLGLPDRYYFNTPFGSDERPAAMYAMGYTDGGQDGRDDLFKKLTDAIAEQGYEICGPAFEDYPINGFSAADSSQYLTRLMITVKKSGKQ